MQYNCLHMCVHMYCHVRVRVHNRERGSFSLTSGHPGWPDYFTMHVAHFFYTVIGLQYSGIFSRLEIGGV